MKIYKVVKTTCKCHPETCPHWNYYLELIEDDSKITRLDGSDNYEELSTIASRLNNISEIISKIEKHLTTEN